MTSSTSMNGIRLISGSSGRCRRKLSAIADQLLRGTAKRIRCGTSRSDGLLHLEHVAVDQAAEVAVEHQRRDRDHQAEGGVVERDRDAVREQRRVVAAARRLRAEDLDHADHGAHQAQQRRRRGDRAERVQVALEPVHRGAAGGLEGGAQAGFGDARLGDHRAQAGGEHGAEHRVLGQLVDDVGRRQVRARHRDHFVEQPRRRDADRAQTRESFDDQRQGGDRADEQRPDRPTGGLYDRKQYGPFRRAKAAEPHRSLELWRAVGGLRNSVALARDIPDIGARRSGASRSRLRRWTTLWTTRAARAPQPQTRGLPDRLLKKAARKNRLNINHLQRQYCGRARHNGPQRQYWRGCGVVASRRRVALPMGEPLRESAVRRRVWSVGALVGAVAALLEQELPGVHRARRDLRLLARRQRPLLLHAEGSRRRRGVALRHVPARGVAARLRAARRPARRAARPARRLRAARRAAVRRRGHAARGRRRAVRALPAPARAARGRGPVRCRRASGRCRRIRARSASSPRSAGAALHDVATTLARRAPHVRVVVYPSVGAGRRRAGGALRGDRARRPARRGRRPDRLPRRRLARGPVGLQRRARRARDRAAPMPVVSGVGHETDVTLADLAADLRAPTPTAAAELVGAGDGGAARRRSTALAAALARRSVDALETQAQRLDRLALRLARPGEALARRRHALDCSRQRLARRAGARARGAAGRAADAAAARLGHALAIAPVAHRGAARARRRCACRRSTRAGCCARGYALLIDRDGRPVTSVARLAVGAERQRASVPTAAPSSTTTAIEPAEPRSADSVAPCATRQAPYNRRNRNHSLERTLMEHTLPPLPYADGRARAARSARRRSSTTTASTTTPTSTT